MDPEKGNAYGRLPMGRRADSGLVCVVLGRLPPNDIEFRGERKRVRCNEGLGGTSRSRLCRVRPLRKQALLRAAIDLLYMVGYLLQAGRRTMTPRAPESLFFGLGDIPREELPAQANLRSVVLLIKG